MNQNEYMNNHDEQKENKKVKINKGMLGKILYPALIAVVASGSTFFIADAYYGRNSNVIVSEDGETTIYQEVVEQVVLTQEEAQISAIESVSEAVVGVVNFRNNTAQGQGSGVVYKVANGDTYIVTNEHVVSDGDYFEVVFDNDENDRFEAVLVGSDVYTDLAVLKIEGYEAETVAKFGNTEDLAIGQTVIAIGNPLGLDFAGSATSGIVSGHDRTITVNLNNSYEEWEMTVLQTDAAINSGNSGGALINLNGEVVGINSMKIASGSVEGMSFSIPTYVILPTIEDLEAHGEVKRPTLGVNLMSMSNIPDRYKQMLNISTDQRTGLYVDTVSEGSLAEKMGIQSSDIIIAIGDVEVEDMITFRKELFNYSEGEEIKITVLRDGKEIELSATVVIS